MSNAALAVLCILSATALAQTPPAASSTARKGAALAQAPAQAPAAQGAAAQAPAEAGAPAAGTPSDEVRREVEAQLEDAKQELREEVRAQLATQQAASGFEVEPSAAPTRRLELLTLDGYLRTRPRLLNNFGLGRGLDASGFPLYPGLPTTATQAFADMRLRLEPTINVSEEVAIKMQVDVLDNLVFGSTPESGFVASPYYLYDVFNETQLTPSSGVNSFTDSIRVKRAYGEVSTPVGVLRFGRMGAHWGLGLQYNDGNCLDCDHGDTVDRIMFVTEVFDGFYVAPMVDFNVEGLVNQRRGGQGEPVDYTNLDDAHSLSLAIARRDTDQQRLAKLEAGQPVFNYGLNFSYRTQNSTAPFFYGAPLSAGTDTGAGNPGQAADPGQASGAELLLRRATLYVPDLWAKFETRDLRIEAEVVGIVGSINAGQLVPGEREFAVDVRQFGGALQGEYKLIEGNLKLGLEVGFASGDQAPGMGARPGRRPQTARSSVGTVPGDIDGPQIRVCPPGSAPETCTDDFKLRNFRFDRDYRVDTILFRELFTAVTDAVYARPSARYMLAPGLELSGAAIYSRTLFQESSPSGASPELGLELNAGASYTTEDGFIAGVNYGILFPLAGMRQPNAQEGTELSNAQTVRGFLGIRF
jgi:uncharacterized protein (TIGR04551 family)